MRTANDRLVACPNCGEWTRHTAECETNVADGLICGDCREIRDPKLLRWVSKYAEVLGCECASNTAYNPSEEK